MDHLTRGLHGVDYSNPSRHGQWQLATAAAMPLARATTARRTWAGTPGVVRSLPPPAGELQGQGLCGARALPGVRSVRRLHATT